MRSWQRLGVGTLALLIAPSVFAQQPLAPYEEVPPPVVAPPPMQPQPYYYQPAAPQMRPCHEELQPRYGLIIAGAVVLGASWSINAAVAWMADEWRLAVPVAGPFMEISQVDTSYDVTNRMLVGLLVFDGLIQTAGAAMLIAGAATHQRVRVYDKGPTQVSIVPTANGIAAFGRF
jgi:hypothetical protein